jgi:hypothetical protein
MNLLKKTLCFSMIVAITTISGFAQSANDAKLTVEKFYKLYRTRNGIVSTHELNVLKPWFTIELTKLFQREILREEEFAKKHHDDKPHFGDGFPFAPYDECLRGGKVVLNQIAVTEGKVVGNTTNVTVDFLQPKECGGEFSDSYQIALIKGKNRWLISDWIYADDTKLTDDLKRKDY